MALFHRMSQSEVEEFFEINMPFVYDALNQDVVKKLKEDKDKLYQPLKKTAN